MISHLLFTSPLALLIAAPIFVTPTEFFCARAYKTYCKKLFPCLYPPVLSRLVPPSQAMLSDCRTLDSSDGEVKKVELAGYFYGVRKKANQSHKGRGGFLGGPSWHWGWRSA